MIQHGMEGFTFESIGAACNPLYRNHVNYAVFIVMVLPFAFILRLHTKKQSIHRLLIDVVILLYLLGIYFSYTRGAWLAIPVMLIIVYCVRKRMLRFLYPLGVLFGILFFVYLFLLRLTLKLSRKIQPKWVTTLKKSIHFLTNQFS